MQQISLSAVGGSAAIAEVVLQADNSKWASTHGVGDRTAVWAITGNLGRVIHRAGCLAIILSFPFIAVFMWHVNEHCGGSATRFLQQVVSSNSSGIAYLQASYPRPSLLGLRYILSFGLVQALLQVFLPGKRFVGPPTPRGNCPVYFANGVLSYLTTLLLFLAGWHFGIFNPGAVYNAMGTIISTSNVVSLALCVLLYAKGALAPSSSDSGSTGSLLFDFYWGMELYPRIGTSFDIKTWTNCRMGMMGWAVLTLCYAAKQAQTTSTGLPTPSMALTVGLMQLYVFKFFLWETGYWSSMDIAHDRAGFYLCWGCLVWVPAVYTSPAMYLVKHPGTMSSPLAIAVFLAGAACIYVNYDSDRQRHAFRQRLGKCKIWGTIPKKIEARYVTADGRVKTSLLLASGWWGLARHFHYLPELLGALAWSCSAGTASIVPYVYCIFLSALLVDRSYRDDERCLAKYGKSWELYCSMVPYRIVPFVY